LRLWRGYCSSHNYECALTPKASLWGSPTRGRDEGWETGQHYWHYNSGVHSMCGQTQSKAVPVKNLCSLPHELALLRNDKNWMLFNDAWHPQEKLPPSLAIHKTFLGQSHRIFVLVGFGSLLQRPLDFTTDCLCSSQKIPWKWGKLSSEGKLSKFWK
jgi:hypothetical protein